MTKIGVLMMVKNEKLRISVTLESIKNFADCLIIYDTGSSDNTIEICENFSKQNNIPLYLKQGEFVNFEVSRNISLDFADTVEFIDYLLLLDTNDELKGGDKLRKIAEEYLKTDKTGFLIQQEWFSGHINRYYNIRFIKSRDKWRYKGVVHEYICNPDNENDYKMHKIVDKDIYIYQDRTQDDNKTSIRFKKDEKLLLEAYKNDPEEPRTVFYLAQTYSCLNNYEKAFYYYRLRTTLIGFYEERFESMMNCGNISIKLNHEWHDSMKWYIKAFELIPRAEPLVKITEYYQKHKNWLLAYTFINLASQLEYPNNCTLFVDRMSYDYKRWHLKGIVSYYAGFFDEGEEACKKAILAGIKNNLNVEIDKNNLKFYKDRKKM